MVIHFEEVKLVSDSYGFLSGMAKKDREDVCPHAPGCPGATKVLVLQMPAWQPQWWEGGHHFPSALCELKVRIRKQNSQRELELLNPTTF